MSQEKTTNSKTKLSANSQPLPNSISVAGTQRQIPLSERKDGPDTYKMTDKDD